MISLIASIALFISPFPRKQHAHTHTKKKEEDLGRCYKYNTPSPSLMLLKTRLQEVLLLAQ